MLLESLRGKIADLGKAGENANGKVFRGHAKHLVGIWRQFFMCDHQTHKKYGIVSEALRNYRLCDFLKAPMHVGFTS